MINRRIVFRGQRGSVLKWEPLGEALCDVLIRFDDGSECWCASHEIRPDPEDILAGIPLPNRAATRSENDRRTLAQLQTIRANHVRDFHKPWPGAEHGKAIVGQALDQAINDVRGRR